MHTSASCFCCHNSYCAFTCTHVPHLAKHLWEFCGGGDWLWGWESWSTSSLYETLQMIKNKVQRSSGYVEEMLHKMSILLVPVSGTLQKHMCSLLMLEMLCIGSTIRLELS